MAARNPHYVDMAVRVARKVGLAPWEFVGGLFAEGFDPYASRPARKGDWRKYWDPPEPRFDVSFGFGQKNVRYSREYEVWCEQNDINYYSMAADVYPGDEIIQAIRDKYILDPEYAMTVAAEGYKHWRYNPEVEPLRAWSAYNGPVYYNGWVKDDGTVVTWRDNPNVPHYAESLAEAKLLLGTQEPPMTFDPLKYDPSVPRSIQNNGWTCAIRTLHWMLLSVGIYEPIEALHDRMVPELVTEDDGLLNAQGYGEGIERVLKEFLPEQYHDLVHRYTHVSWADVLNMAGHGPMALGGRAWVHWTAVSGRTADGLELKNPARSGHMGVLHTMNEGDFNRLGSWGAVWLNMTAAQTLVGQPDLVARVQQLEAELAGKNNVLGYLTVDVADALQAAVNSLRAHKPQ